MARELVNGVELAVRQSGEGRPALCIHETAAAGRIWEGFAEAASGMAGPPSSTAGGWGESQVPEGYRRTTVAEQAEDAAVLIERLADGPAVDPRCRTWRGRCPRPRSAATRPLRGGRPDRAAAVGLPLEATEGLLR